MKSFNDLTCDTWNYSLTYSTDLLCLEMADKDCKITNKLIFWLDKIFLDIPNGDKLLRIKMFY